MITDKLRKERKGIFIPKHFGNLGICMAREFEIQLRTS